MAVPDSSLDAPVVVVVVVVVVVASSSWLSSEVEDTISRLPLTYDVRHRAENGDKDEDTSPCFVLSSTQSWLDGFRGCLWAYPDGCVGCGWNADACRRDDEPQIPSTSSRAPLVTRDGALDLRRLIDIDCGIVGITRIQYPFSLQLSGDSLQY